MRYSFLSLLLNGKEIQLHVGHREQLHAAFGIVRDLQYKLL
jgi:hypothetical protein